LDKGLAGQSGPEPKNEPKPLLNLQAGADSKLEKAFRALVGPARPVDLNLARLKTFFRELGFTISNGQITHPATPGRQIALPAQAGEDTVVEGNAFIARHFPETDFYLPFIMAKARLLDRLRSGGTLEPEPEYDEDGFISG
jgi:hypothetical protein